MSTDSTLPPSPDPDMTIPLATGPRLDPALTPPPADAAVAASVPAFTAATGPAVYDPPRVRWAGIVWGLFFAVVAGLGLWMIVDPRQRAGLGDWLATLTPGALIASAVLAAGVLVLLTGAAGLLRRAQSGLARRRG